VLSLYSPHKSYCRPTSRSVVFFVFCAIPNWWNKDIHKESPYPRRGSQRRTNLQVLVLVLGPLAKLYPPHLLNRGATLHTPTLAPTILPGTSGSKVIILHLSIKGWLSLALLMLYFSSVIACYRVGSPSRNALVYARATLTVFLHLLDYRCQRIYYRYFFVWKAWWQSLMVAISSSYRLYIIMVCAFCTFTPC